MKLTGSYLKNELLKVLYFIITGLPGNLLFSYYLLKVEKAAPEPSPGHTLVNRFTKHYNKICNQGMVLLLGLSMLQPCVFYLLFNIDEMPTLLQLFVTGSFAVLADKLFQ